MCECRSVCVFEGSVCKVWAGGGVYVCVVLWHKIMFLIFVWECFGHVSLLLPPAPLCCLLTTAQDTHTHTYREHRTFPLTARSFSSISWSVSSYDFAQVMQIAPSCRSSVLALLAKCCKYF